MTGRAGVLEETVTVYVDVYVGHGVVELVKMAFLLEELLDVL
jgi:hypothetical protein